jgi:hypothetical protein
VAHRVALPADETTLRDGVPVTSVARTLLDLAAVWKPDRVARALGRAEGEHLYEHASALDLAGRHPRHPGARRLVVLLEGHRPPPVTKSELEERFLAFLAARGFPPPRVNAPLRLADRWVEPDCRWDAERVVVELDSRLHDGLDAIEADHARDAALQAAGWVVMRVRWRRLHRDPDGVARELWLLLRR